MATGLPFSLNCPLTAIKRTKTMIRSADKKKKILVVEDEPVVGKLCARILTSEGFDVDIVQNGRIAKEVAIDKNYDICVSDIRLPEMTGIELHKLLKANHSPLAHRMIFITGDTMSASIQSFLQEADVSYLLKPFLPEDLITAVMKILE
jgi:two-component system NtrC family sensor kinase